MATETGSVARGGPLHVRHFTRRPGPRLFSLETHFERVRDGLPADIRCDVHVCRYASRGVWKRLAAGFQAWRNRAPVNHILGDVHFLALFLPGRRTLLSIADCVPMHQYRGLKKALIRLFWYELPVRRAALVSAISEATRRELVERLGCDARKIVVVHVCISDRFRPAPRVFDAVRPTVLQVGTGPNKNLPRLAAALARLPCLLHVVGPLDGEQRAALARHGITYTGGTEHSMDELVDAYERSDIVAFVSTYEGFGMPVLEANVVERVVVAGDIPALRETAGGAACLVDPLDPAAIRAGVQRVIADPAYREDLIARGRENRRRFDAQTIAARYAELYRTLAGV